MIEDAMVNRYLRRGKWTVNVAVGCELYVNATKQELGIKAQGREVTGADGSYELPESSAPYNAD